MTIEKLQRVLWRIRTKNPGTTKINNLQLQRAIMIECGTHPITYTRTRHSLKKLGWIKTEDNAHVILTGLDLNESF